MPQWSTVNAMWMPCECHVNAVNVGCWPSSFASSVRVGFFRLSCPNWGNSQANGTCTPLQGWGFIESNGQDVFLYKGDLKGILRGQRYSCAIHHEIVPQTWNACFCCFLLFYVVFLLFWVFPDTVSLQFLSALQCILLGWRSFFLPLGVLKPKDWERNSSRERGCHYLPGWSKLLWGNQILQFNEGASWLQLRAALRLKLFRPGLNFSKC